MKRQCMKCRLNFLVAMMALVIAGSAAISLMFADTVHAEDANYDLNATVADGLPGVYRVLVPASSNGQTIGIPSIAKQTLADHATKELPAIIMGAAVNYELRTGPTDFTPFEGARLLPPYSYFRWNVMDEQRKEPDGSTSTHRKLGGFDGSYYIIRVDVSAIIADAQEKAEAAGETLEGKYLHVRQQNNKALLVATGMTDNSYVWADANKGGCKAAAYPLANSAEAMKDTEGDDRDKPYLDVILVSSAKNVAGADAGGQSAPVPDVDLAFYVDGTSDYKPWLKALDPNNMPTFPYTIKDGDGNDVTFQNETEYNTALTTKFFDETKAGAQTSSSTYLVKGGDLEIDVAVDNNEDVEKLQSDGAAGEKKYRSVNWLQEKMDFWSMEKAIASQGYDKHTIILICEVPVLDAMNISGTSERTVVLDVNSFDIQIANNTEQGKAGLTIGNNASLRIKDGSNTAGAELAIGNNATMIIEKGGIMVIDETCTAEAEYDAASTAGSSQTPVPDFLSGEIVVKDGGKLINHGVVNIEGTEGKPIDPAQQEPIIRGKKTADILVKYGGVLDNYGCLSLKGILYVLGTLNNYGQYNDILRAYDPDKNVIDYHRGIQVTWKDDVTQEGVEPGVLNIGIDADGNVNMKNQAVLNNYGDIVLVPGTLGLYGIFNNAAETNGYAGHLYLCTVTEAIIPIVNPNDPLQVEKRVTIDPPKASVFVNNGEFNNNGVVGEARVALIHNGVLGELTPLLNIDGAEVGLSATSFAYNGKVQKPSVTTIGGNQLTLDKDYTVSYSDASSTNVGEYTVTVTGIGDCKGTATATYNITKADQVITAKDVKKSVVDAAFMLGAKTDGDGALSYSSTDTRIVTVDKTGKVTIKGLGKTTITVNAAATANYNAASKIVKITINRKSISKAKVTGVKSKAYTGKSVTQSPTVKVGKKTLKKNTDYKLTYKKNINVGTATMTITGIGNYKGSIKKNFKIKRAPVKISAKTVTLSAKELKYEQKNVKTSRAFKVTKNEGKTIFKKKSGNEKITVDRKGNVIVKRGLREGTYRVKVKVTAYGDKHYKKTIKAVTLKIDVK